MALLAACAAVSGADYEVSGVVKEYDDHGDREEGMEGGAGEAEKGGMMVG